MTRKVTSLKGKLIRKVSITIMTMVLYDQNLLIMVPKETGSSSSDAISVAFPPLGKADPPVPK